MCYKNESNELPETDDESVIPVTSTEVSLALDVSLASDVVSVAPKVND